MAHRITFTDDEGQPASHGDVSVLLDKAGTAGLKLTWPAPDATCSLVGGCDSERTLCNYLNLTAYLAGLPVTATPTVKVTQVAEA